MLERGVDYTEAIPLGPFMHSAFLSVNFHINTTWRRVCFHWHIFRGISVSRILQVRTLTSFLLLFPFPHSSLSSSSPCFLSFSSCCCFSLSSLSFFLVTRSCYVTQAGHEVLFSSRLSGWDYKITAPGPKSPFALDLSDNPGSADLTALVYPNIILQSHTVILDSTYHIACLRSAWNT